jgi:uracil phosphoribosyltransferase
MMEGARPTPMAGREQPPREAVLGYPQLHVVEHPLLAAQLTLLRDARTEPPRFRALLGEVSGLLGYAALADLPLAPRPIATPLESATGYAIAEDVAIVPILRAGLAMVDGLLRLVPQARVWHLGLYRDEATLRPVPYYNRAMRGGQAARVLVVDPMLATGGSATSAVELVKAVGAARITCIGLVAAPYGVARLVAAHPDVQIYVAALDRELDERGYIRPGLGDAGDRAFYTEDSGLRTQD